MAKKITNKLRTVKDLKEALEKLPDSFTLEPYGSRDAAVAVDVSARIVYLDEEDWIDEHISSLNIHMIEQKALAYEQGKMLRSDSEVEINLSEGLVWICDYSPSREGAEFVEAVCDASTVNTDDIVSMCDKHDWGYVL